MGDLAKHIAEAARRIYPEPALPAVATELFTEMQQFLSMTADKRPFVLIENRGLPAEFARLGFTTDPLFAIPTA